MGSVRKTMQYRRFDKLDWEGSVLGFGCMRLPQTDANPENINEPEAIRMIRHAIDHGVNYLDSSYVYNKGCSEVTIGRALRDGYRQKVRIATKLPPALVHSHEDCDRILNKQLERLQTDKIDFYLLHGMDKANWTKLRDLEVLRWAEGVMAQGRIGHLGFSFHDDLEIFKEIVDAYDNWTFCQIQYNFMDENYQAGTRGLKYAAEKGLAVVIMEPLRGGRLSKQPPERVARVWESAPQKLTPAEWGLRWVWNHPDVSVVLSGMSAMQHVVENVAAADRARANVLQEDELALFDQVREAYRELMPIPCTSCRYCMPCPFDVEIPRVFEFYNDAILYNESRMTVGLYRAGVREENRADRCTECGECLVKCPQHIEIPEWLIKAHALLGPKPKT